MSISFFCLFAFDWWNSTLQPPDRGHLVISVGPAELTLVEHLDDTRNQTWLNYVPAGSLVHSVKHHFYFSEMFDVQQTLCLLYMYRFMNPACDLTLFSAGLPHLWPCLCVGRSESTSPATSLMFRHTSCNSRWMSKKTKKNNNPWTPAVPGVVILSDGWCFRTLPCVTPPNQPFTFSHLLSQRLARTELLNLLMLSTQFSLLVSCY